jgi:type IV pilus assembly protein PilE
MFMKIRGFSLMELMITLSIIGIFISYTYPSFRESITRSRRLDGQTALIDLANRMEHYFAEHHTYQGAILGREPGPDILSSKDSPQNWYSLVIIRQSDSDYSLQAIPKRSQAKDDQACQTLGLDSSGRKTIQAGPNGLPTGSSTHCW